MLSVKQKGALVTVAIIGGTILVVLLARTGAFGKRAEEGVKKIEQKVSTVSEKSPVSTSTNSDKLFVVDKTRDKGLQETTPPFFSLTDEVNSFISQD